MAKARDLGSYIAVHTGNRLASHGSGSVTSSPAFIERGGAQSIVFYLLTGKTSGAPTTQRFESKIQSSLDSVSGWTDLTQLYSVSAVDSFSENNVVLDGAKTYIRALASTAFTGGTAPTLQAGSIIVLGGSRYYGI